MLIVGLTHTLPAKCWYHEFAINHWAHGNFFEKRRSTPRAWYSMTVENMQQLIVLDDETNLWINPGTLEPHYLIPLAFPQEVLRDGSSLICKRILGSSFYHLPSIFALRSKVCITMWHNTALNWRQLVYIFLSIVTAFNCGGLSVWVIMLTCSRAA